MKTIEDDVAHGRKNVPCSLCCGVWDDFDYCRVCGFTVRDISSKEKQPEESSLAKVIKMSRGGDAPIKFKGYA